MVEAAEAVMDGWFTAEAGAIVTVEPETVAMPVKSSIRSSWPEARLEFERGRVKALTTGVAAELVKLMVSTEPMTEAAFARLTSMPIPALPPMATEVVIVDVKGPGNVATHTAPAGHEGVRLVMAAPVPLKNAISAPEKVTAMLV